jgi:hypothetical protein
VQIFVKCMFFPVKVTFWLHAASTAAQSSGADAGFSVNGLRLN